MNPYEGLPDKRYWRLGVAECNPNNLAEIHSNKWSISKTDTFVTMGSCFAQHIGNKLKSLGFCVPFYDDQEGIKSVNYSANYGNVYTVRQALLLLSEALGQHTPSEIAWACDGGYLDAFRPNVFTKPFADKQAVLNSRKSHLEAVLKAINELDVLVFTLGLTETWVVSECGSVLPSAPGVLGGVFDNEKYSFKNLTFNDVYSDLNKLIAKLEEARQGKPFKMLLTVSPVPLTATAEDKHILQASTYSKSVLRAVAGQVITERENVDYFPSFEIVTNPKVLASNYMGNLRSVAKHAVDNVMNHFEAAYFPPESKAQTNDNITSISANTFAGTLEEVGDVDCEDALLDQFASHESATGSPSNNPSTIFFGSSFLGSFSNALSDSSVTADASFAPINFIGNDPFKELEKHRFRKFSFTTPEFPDIHSPDAKYLVVVGMGLFGDALIRALGPVSVGYAGCDRKDINVQLDATVSAEHQEKYRNSINLRLGLIQSAVDKAAFEKVLWLVSPDFPEPCARFRLGDEFVDSGNYNLYKEAYKKEFDSIIGEQNKIEFLFHDDSQLSESGFLQSKYEGKTPWDIHPSAEYYLNAAKQIENKLIDLRNSEDTPVLKTAV